ncbi:MAG: hypothetical protein LBC40_09000 [Dysgonamonadaceae bacterium]|jgi:hypothetical protein|nr:hypothetical protein [Dysgonamonadaceae bacterium]
MSDEEFTGTENWVYLQENTPEFDTRIFDRIIALQETLSKLYPEEFNQLVSSCLGSASPNMATYSKGGRVPNEYKIARFRGIIKKLNLPDKELILLEMELSVVLTMKEWDKALEMVAASESAMKPFIYSMVMSEIAGGCSDREILLKTIELTEKVFQKEMSGRDEYGACNDEYCLPPAPVDFTFGSQ